MVYPPRRAASVLRPYRSREVVSSTIAQVYTSYRVPAQARGLRRLRRDVDRDAAHLEIARTVDRRDPAPALDLRKRTRAKKERGTGQRREQGTDTHRARLLAKRGR